MRKILEKIFLDEIQGHKKTVCISCGNKTNLNQYPFISIAVLRAVGTCICSYCVNKAPEKKKLVWTMEYDNNLIII